MRADLVGGRLHALAGDARAKRRTQPTRAQTLLRDMERYATGIGCRHRHLVGVLRRVAMPTAAAAARATAAWTSSKRSDSPVAWRGRFCRVWRASVSAWARRMSRACCVDTRPTRCWRADTTG